MKVEFKHSVGAFSAARAACEWCEKRGISVGSMQQGSPRGLLFGDFIVAKWRNLSASERACLHGTMTGDMRYGPVVVDLDDEAARRMGLLDEAEGARPAQKHDEAPAGPTETDIEEVG